MEREVGGEVGEGERDEVDERGEVGGYFGEFKDVFGSR